MLRRDFLYGGLLLGVSLWVGNARAAPERTKAGTDGRGRTDPSSDPCASGNCGLEFRTRGNSGGGLRSAMNLRMRSGRGRRGRGRRGYRGGRSRSRRRFRRRRFRVRRKRFRSVRRYR